MLKSEVVIGRTYVAKVSGKLTNVRIVKQVGSQAKGIKLGWYAVNTATGREVFIKSAARLRSESKPKRCISIPIEDQFRTTTCANCVAFLQKREEFTERYRAAIDSGTQEEAVRLRQEFKLAASCLPCTNPVPVVENTKGGVRVTSGIDPLTGKPREPGV